MRLRRPEPTTKPRWTQANREPAKEENARPGEGDEASFPRRAGAAKISKVEEAPPGIVDGAQTPAERPRRNDRQWTMANEQGARSEKAQRPMAAQPTGGARRRCDVPRPGHEKPVKNACRSVLVEWACSRSRRMGRENFSVDPLQWPE